MTYKELQKKLESYAKEDLILKNQILVGRMESYSVFIKLKDKDYDRRILSINKSQYNKLIKLGYEHEVNLFKN